MSTENLVPAVYKAIADVAAEIAKTGVGKTRKNVQQGYTFRGIDECMNALAPLLAAHGLVILPTVEERSVVERQTKSGGALFYTTVRVRFAFVAASDGSHCDVVTYGEAMDSGDKSTNKSMSAAYKYAVMQSFCIPTEGDNDADAHTHEVQSLPAQIRALCTEKGVDVAKVAAKYSVETVDDLDDVQACDALAKLQAIKPKAA